MLTSKIRAEDFKYLSVLELIGFAGLATSDQAAEVLAFDLSETDVWDTFEYIIARKFIGEIKNYGFENPLDKPILYLTARGAKELQSKLPATARFMYSGYEQALELGKTTKSLLMTESVLEWKRLNLPKIDFYNKKRLTDKEQIEKLFYRGFQITEGNVSCDYAVLIYMNPDTGWRFGDCRIAIKQSIKNIQESGEQIIWFAASAAQQKLLEQADKFILKTIDPLGTVRWQELNTRVGLWLSQQRGTVPDSGKILNTFEQSIYKFLSDSRMPFSIYELKRILLSQASFDDTKLTAKLAYVRKKLVSNGLVKIQKGKTRPSFNFGSPPHFMYLPENEEYFVGKNFQRSIILSYLCSKKCEEGWKFSHFEPGEPLLVMSRKKEYVLFFSDYADGERDESVEKTLERFKQTVRKAVHQVKLVVVDYERYYKIVEKIDRELIVNLSGDFDQYVLPMISRNNQPTRNY